MTKLKLQYVSDKIGDEYKSWNNGDVVFITAQTGTGKNYFVENVLLQYCIDNNKKILYIGNRLNLKRQVKINILQQQGIDATTLDDETIDNMTELGKITVVSYHQIQTHLINLEYFTYYIRDNYSGFDYIVMDEVQYVLQDSSFNNKIDFFYKRFICNYKQESVVIYMSATADNIKPELVNYYKQFDVKLKEYTTNEDYSYVETYYFKKFSDIATLINNDTSDNKWLIFVSNMTIGINLLGTIADSKFICSEGANQKYVDKMDKTELHNIIHNNYFDCKCLITTKTLDNGINLYCLIL